MSKAHHHRSARKAHARSKPARQGAPDGAIYLGILMIGAFGVFLWHIMGGEWQHALVGFTIAVAVLVNLYTWRVCRGQSVLPWQAALARLPLRCAGYGTKGGKPIEAAHGSDRAKIMLYLSIATSAVVIVVLTVLLIPM